MMMMYRLNAYGKIVVSEKEVYYGCISELDKELEIAKLFILDWRDKDFKPHHFKEMIVPLNKFTIKYEVEQ